MVEITPDLAELCGIHAGDGYLRNDGRRIELDISGNIDEKEYYDVHVKGLFKGAFNIDIEPRSFPLRSTYGLVIRDKRIVTLFNNLGFPYGKKTDIVDVAHSILMSNDTILYARFLRGLFDTDGHLGFRKRYKGYTKFKRSHHTYPFINLSFVSPKLAFNVASLLHQLKIPNFISEYTPKTEGWHQVYTVTINGVLRLDTWMRLVGMKNKSKLSRYLVWKKLGFCPTNLTFQQRQDILNGKIDPLSLGP